MTFWEPQGFLHLSPRGRIPLAIFHIVVWLIHAILQAIASALVAIFSHVASAVIVGAAIVLGGLAIAAACGVFGSGLFGRLRSGNGRPE